MKLRGKNRQMGGSFAAALFFISSLFFSNGRLRKLTIYNRTRKEKNLDVDVSA